MLLLATTSFENRPVPRLPFLANTVIAKNAKQRPIVDAPPQRQKLKLAGPKTPDLNLICALVQWKQVFNRLFRVDST